MPIQGLIPGIGHFEAFGSALRRRGQSARLREARPSMTTPDGMNGGAFGGHFEKSGVTML